MIAKTYAKIEDNIVVDIHLVAWDFLQANRERYQGQWIPVNNKPCAVGWIWDGTNFVEPNPPEENIEEEI